MTKRMSGGLLDVLKVARVAWYQGQDGTRAYYEQPSPGVPGRVVINGRKIMHLVVDEAGHYADVPCQQVQHQMVEHGLSLHSGWTCRVETFGLPFEEAMEQSRSQAVRHHTGQMSAQWDPDGQRIILFVRGVKRWSIPRALAHRILAEMGTRLSDGWYPVDQD